MPVRDIALSTFAGEEGENYSEFRYCGKRSGLH